MLFAADRAKVPVCVHLDHGTDFDYVKRALDIGFTSVMYEGSMLPLEQNIASTAYVVHAAEQAMCEDIKNAIKVFSLIK